jgi:O-antigen/teichoic acid export membrane protein
MVAGGTVVGAIGYVITPRLAIYFKKKELRKFVLLGTKSILIGLAIGLIGTLIAGLFGNNILVLFYGEDYAQYSQVFTIIMLSATLWYLAGLAGCLINATRKFKYQIYSNLLSFISTLISSLYLYNDGLVGVSWAIVIGMTIRLLLNILFISSILISTKRKIV